MTSKIIEGHISLLFCNVDVPWFFQNYYPNYNLDLCCYRQLMSLFFYLFSIFASDCIALHVYKKYMYFRIYYFICIGWTLTGLIIISMICTIFIHHLFSTKRDSTLEEQLGVYEFPHWLKFIPLLMMIELRKGLIIDRRKWEFVRHYTNAALFISLS